MQWVTADHHFGHTNVIAYDSRPFRTVDEMNREMIRRWNEVVKPEDTVYHLGDFALMPKEAAQRIFDSLNGHKCLILGNHDRGPNAMAEMGWEWVSKGPVVLYREPGIYGDEEFGNIMVTYPSYVILNHYPDIAMGNEYGLPHGQMLNCAVNCWDYYPIPMPVPRHWLVIHGHTHNGLVVGHYVDRTVRT